MTHNAELSLNMTNKNNTPSTSATTSPLPPRAPTEVAANRQLFWENVIRDMLTGLSIEMGRARAEQIKSGEAPNDQKGVPMYDGRVAVITTLGARIPIADVQPMLACSIATSDAHRALSAEVQCSVFQIRTPAGEVFTIPLNQISSVHVLTADLLNQLEGANAAHTGEGDGQAKPFGYSAFTELYHDPAMPLDGETPGTE